MTMELEDIIPAIIKALIRKSRMVVIDKRWNVGYNLWRLIPNRLWVKMPINVSTKADPVETAENTVVEEAEATPV